MTDSLPNIEDINFDELSYFEPIKFLSKEEIQEIEQDADITREKLAKLYRGEGYTIKEISEITDISPTKLNRLTNKYKLYKNSYTYLDKGSPEDIPILQQFDRDESCGD